MEGEFENIEELRTIRYIDYKIRNVTKIKNKYGFRVVLILEDKSEKVVQHAGYAKKEIAEKERCKIIAQLENKTYIVYRNITVEEYMKYWYKYQAPKRIKSYNSYMSYKNGIFNQIIPKIGKIELTRLSSGIIKQFYKDVYDYSRSVAKMVQTIMISSLEDAKVNKFVSTNEALDVALPKDEEKIIKENTTEKADINYHTLTIDERDTFTIEQIATIIKASRNTPIYMQVLFASLMGFRKSEINGFKYSDVDFIHRRLNLTRQLR